MKIKDGFVLREVGGQAVVIATGGASKTFHGMIKLNSTAMDIWKLMESGLDAESIADSITEKYNIDRESAASDIKEFIEKMEKAGFIEL